MFKRIWLFLITNLAIIVVLSLAIFLIERIFWINVTWYLGWGYTWLLIFAAIFWFGWAFISLALSKWMAKKAYWIKLVTIEDYYDLDSKQKIVFDVVKDLAERENIKMPEVWFYNSAEPNAFATGASKNKSLVAVSSGLLNTMDKNEIEWVVGHEMAHVLNWDMVTMTLLQWVLNTFVIFISRILAWIVDNFLSNWEESNWFSWTYIGFSILFEIVFWVLASLITMKFSRYREFKADAWSAKYVWKEKMIASLEALKRMKDMASWDDSKFATMKISTKGKSWLRALFSSHPELDDRINHLKNLNM